jgi:hypothetical protein
LELDWDDEEVFYLGLPGFMLGAVYDSKAAVFGLAEADLHELDCFFGVGVVEFYYLEAGLVDVCLEVDRFD